MEFYGFKYFAFVIIFLHVFGVTFEYVNGFLYKIFVIHSISGEANRDTMPQNSAESRGLKYLNGDGVS